MAVSVSMSSFWRRSALATQLLFKIKVLDNLDELCHMCARRSYPCYTQWCNVCNFWFHHKCLAMTPEEWETFSQTGQDLHCPHCTDVRGYTSSPLPPSSVLNKFLLLLNQYFHDVEHLISWNSWMRNRVVRQKNVFYGYTQKNFGVNVAAAYYILGLGGSFRFKGQSEWFRPDSRGKFSFDFLNTPELTIEEIDLNRTLINHAGLENIVSQEGLRSLCLQGCVEVDDWLLAHLHVFGESLQELDLSHCPRITEGGLAALQHLRKLRRLDVSSLPRLKNPGLVQILLEEMLPHCEITGAAYEQGLIHTEESKTAELQRHSKETQMEKF